MFKKFLFTFMLVAISWLGYSQCAGIMFNTSINGNTATFVSTLPPGYTANGYTWSFGDGGNSNAANPVYTYANNGWYNVCMTVWGTTPLNTIFQCSICDSVQIGGAATPCNANFIYTQSGNIVSFSNLATGPGTITNYAWNFGDGNQSNSPNPTHTYATNGTYNACLTIYGVNNGITYTCTYCDTIVVGNPCNASFGWNAGAGNTVFFNNTPTTPGTITTYAWTFGNGATSNVANPTYTYPNSGWYNVCLTVSGFVTGTNTPFSCTYCDSIQVGTPVQPCNANYVSTQSGLTVAFANTSTGPGTITNYAWNFGDGNQSNLQNPTHTYATAGTYVACLTIYGINNNITYTCTYCDTIVVGNPCNASYGWNVGAGNSVFFNNTSTTPGTITTYAWTFGDGGTSNVANPVYTYALSGWYNVCLTVSGFVTGTNTPFSCTYCDSIQVGTPVQPCNANFSSTTSGLNVNFTNLSAGPGTILNYSWTFGDGGTSALQNPSHTYANAGNYTVCLAIQGVNNGVTYTCQYCDSIYVTAGGQPCNASFTSTYTSATTLAFTNTSTGTGTLMQTQWNFGDGGTSVLANPTHTYAFGGWYNVCLTVVYNNNGVVTTCYTCDSVYIQGNPNPGGNCIVNANFSGNVSGLTANFTNTTTCTNCTSISYQWNFGDGGTSTLPNPSHTYMAGGNYNVCLYATGIDSLQMTCTDTFCYTITVGASSVNNVTSKGNLLTVYPNPASNTIDINLPGSGSYEVKLMDVAGQVIRRESINAADTKHTFNVQSLANGMYYLQLVGNEKQYHSSFIKQ